MNAGTIRATGLALLLAGLLGACSTSVERIDSAEVRDLSGAWNDTDSRLVSEEMIADVMARPWIDNHERNARKVREGVVTSAAMDKTIVVTVTDRVRHPKYNKFILRTKKLYAHDQTNDAGVGDKVRVMETRPFSKNKRWRLVDVIERAR